MSDSTIGVGNSYFVTPFIDNLEKFPETIEFVEKILLNVTVLEQANWRHCTNE